VEWLALDSGHRQGGWMPRPVCGARPYPPRLRAPAAEALGLTSRRRSRGGRSAVPARSGRLPLR
jgi:hypothetical protein